MAIGFVLALSGIFGPMSTAEAEVEARYRCTNGDLTRSVVSQLDPPELTQYVCVVWYSSEKGPTTPWRAEHDREYCLTKALGLVRKLSALGWECTSEQDAQ